MKKTCLLISLAAAILVGCTKNNTTNNITTPLPAFTVNGIHDVSLINDNLEEVQLPINITYTDSSQEVVTLSLSSLPAGIVVDTTWVTNGIPSFATQLDFFDTTINGCTPGTYPLTLTATGATTGKKTYTFNLKVSPQTPCISNIVGKYPDCTGCTSGLYSDSVSADPTVVNKIWFSNINNSGSKVYGLFNCASGVITVPAQSIGGTTYSGSGNGWGSSPTSHNISLELSSGTGSCEINME